MYDQNLVVILVEPQGPINIGSICRTMMNFGVRHLRLVNPTKEYKSLQAKKMALTAFTIIENASVFDDLASALADVQVAYGTTRRFGKFRNNFFTPSDAAKMINSTNEDTRSALVMGPEDTGLETADLDLCQHFITIPTHDNYPSMNLSHALSVLLYEVSLKSDIEGKFSGELIVHSLLTLKATATINGDVIISKLSVEPGAEFNAKCTMKGSVKELKNDKTSKEKTASITMKLDYEAD